MLVRTGGNIKQIFFNCGLKNKTVPHCTCNSHIGIHASGFKRQLMYIDSTNCIILSKLIHNLWLVLDIKSFT
jgi:hypothetical protein